MSTHHTIFICIFTRSPVDQTLLRWMCSTNLFMRRNLPKTQRQHRAAMTGNNLLTLNYVKLEHSLNLWVLTWRRRLLTPRRSCRVFRLSFCGTGKTHTHTHSTSEPSWSDPLLVHQKWPLTGAAGPPPHLPPHHPTHQIDEIFITAVPQVRVHLQHN